MSAFGPPKGGWSDTKPKTVPREQKAITGPSSWHKPRTVVKTDYYCPYCATQDMWQEQYDYGDYYTGISTRCESCGQVTDGLDEQWTDKEV